MLTPIPKFLMLHTHTGQEKQSKQELYSSTITAEQSRARWPSSLSQGGNGFIPSFQRKKKNNPNLAALRPKVKLQKYNEELKRGAEMRAAVPGWQERQPCAVPASPGKQCPQQDLLSTPSLVQDFARLQPSEPTFPSSALLPS